ncbi:MAG TPA: DNA repair protein RecO [Bacteroidia bacterium]|nr:DNA repair protein RecO [Bacteroidia bacterium]
MPQTTQGIILQHTRYRDKKSILKIYTLQHGLQSYTVNIGHSKSSKIKAAHVQALNQIEFIEHNRKLREVHLITEIRLTILYRNISSDVIKNCFATFINEVLIKCLKEHNANEEMYFFISEKLKELDTAGKSPANFHLFFLLELSKHLGFYPNNNFTNTNNLFDLQEGIFTEKVPQHLYYADSETSFHMQQLIEADEQKKDFSCNGQIRSELVKTLLLFYRLHIPGFGEMKSLPVLRELLT